MNIIAITLSILLLILTFLFLIRSKVIFLMSATLRIGFFALIIIILSALFIPQVYSFLADFTLKQMGTLESIRKFDDEFIIDDIAGGTQDLWEDVKNFFTGEESEDESVEEEQGLLETNLYPSLVSAIAFLYRALTIILSLAGLVAIIYLSYTTSGVTEVENLKQKVKELQTRVEQLENR